MTLNDPPALENRQARPASSLGHLLGLPREQLAAGLAAALPEVVHGDRIAARDLPFRGGRAAARERLDAIDPQGYARSRNHVMGAVTRLSPWIRHGVLSLAEVRDAALARVARPEEAEKLISELGWRAYWREVQAAVGAAILRPLHPPAAVSRNPERLDAVPPDVLAAATGMACIDAFVRRLHDTGWLHNHERMWLASWLVHVRGVRWEAGANWFLSHLVDGDPASNHLSWQWVAGTFAAKPYLFNRENLETFTDGAHCRECSLLGHCDVEGSYDDLATRWLTAGPAQSSEPLRIRPAEPWRVSDGPAALRPLVWLTLDSAAAASPAAAAFPAAPRLFVLDDAWLATEQPSLKRLVFLLECLADVPGLELVRGDPRLVVPARAAAHGCDAVALADTPCPAIRAAAAAIGPSLPLTVIAWPRFCERSGARDLGRFSRYWQQVKASALRPTG